MHRPGSPFCTAIATLLLVLGIAIPAAAQDPVVVNADLIEVKFENDRVRVFEAELQPGQQEKMHSHPSVVIHVLAGGKMRNHTADGQVTEAELVPGETVYRDPMTHWAENIGSTTIRVLIVEIKERP